MVSKKIFFILVLLLSFTGLSNLEVKAAVGPMVNDPGGGSGYTTLVPGDIFTTSATSFYGITGHSGIAVSENYILHIPGPGHYTERITLANWKQIYTGDTTWVHRVPNLTYTQKSALSKYIVQKYWNAWGDISSPKSIYQDFLFTSNTTNFNKTYCSKIVWQAYWYGTGSLVLNLKRCWLPKLCLENFYTI